LKRFVFNGNISPLIEKLPGEFTCLVFASVTGLLPLVVVESSQNNLSLPFNIQSHEYPRKFSIFPLSITVGSFSSLEIVCDLCSKLTVLRLAGREFSCFASSDSVALCSLKIDTPGDFDLTCEMDSNAVPCGVLHVYECPKISSLVPASSLIGHQSLVTLFGVNFIRTSNLSCIWGTSWSRHHYEDHLLSRAVYLSTTSNCCMVPSNIRKYNCACVK